MLVADGMDVGAGVGVGSAVGGGKDVKFSGSWI